MDMSLTVSSLGLSTPFLSVDNTTTDPVIHRDYETTHTSSNVTLDALDRTMVFPPHANIEKYLRVATCLIVFVLIVAGNGLVLFAISRYRFLQTTSNMFVAVLAVADFTMSISIIFKIVELIRPDLFAGAVPCLVKIVVAISNCISSSLALLGVSSSRYLGTFKPFAYLALVTTRRVKVLLAFIMLYPFLLAVATTAAAQRYDSNLPCYLFVVLPAWAVWLLNFHFGVALPVVAAIYVQILRETLKHRCQIATLVPLPLAGAPSAPDTSSSDEAAKRRHNMSILRTFGIIVGFFTLSWCPYLIFCSVAVNNPISYLRQPTYMRVYSASLYMLVLNCCANPIVYALRLKSFRQGFKLSFRCSSDDEAPGPALDDFANTAL